MNRARDLAAEALADPSISRAWSAPEWSLAFRQARMAGVLSRLADRVRSATAASSPPWPEAAQAQVESAERVARAQVEEIRRELRHIRAALAGLGAPVVLLKGAAYLASGLPPARGRVFSDVDLLVPKAVLGEVESRLMLGGWMTTNLSAYDQRYYRQWMHELPPMQHVHRQTTVDVHHTILPETARLKPDARRLFEGLVPIDAHPGLFVLAPENMVLHSMTHLFLNEEFGHALRDLSDLDLLLRHFAGDPGFWDRLVECAGRMDLERPLHYGLRHLQRVFRTPVPDPVAARVAAFGPPAPLSALMDALWRHALTSPHQEAAEPGRRAALLALYVRGHWMRMPPLLLARHLTIKALRLHERESIVDLRAPKP